MATEAATATMTSNDWTYETYIQYLDQLGESILQWADPEHQFRGHTNVCINIEMCGPYQMLCVCVCVCLFALTVVG
jgi:hypothetical protein